MIKRPMLAATTNISDVKDFPIMVSPKLDGIRCIVIEGVAYSRTMKPIPNKRVQELLGSLPSGLDGEIIIQGLEYNDIQSQVMSVEGRPNITYFVFDKISDRPYIERYLSLISLKHYIENYDLSYVKVLEHHEIYNERLLSEAEAYYVREGYEGIMIRSIEGKYKQGRSTVREMGLCKIKRFKDAEAVIIGVEELMVNKNTVSVSEIGLQKRSKKKDGLVASGTIGSIKVYDLKTGVKFNIGSGFTLQQRKDLFNINIIGQIVTYQYQEVGQKNLPRFPIFKGFRHD